MFPTQLTGHPDARVLDPARATISDLMGRHHVPGPSVAVTNADRLLFAEGFGHADLAAERTCTADTRYLWFSMSKIATATATLRLPGQTRSGSAGPIGFTVTSIGTRMAQK